MKCATCGDRTNERCQKCNAACCTVCKSEYDYEVCPNCKRIVIANGYVDGIYDDGKEYPLELAAVHTVLMNIQVLLGAMVKTSPETMKALESMNPDYTRFVDQLLKFNTKAQADPPE